MVGRRVLMELPAGRDPRQTGQALLLSLLVLFLVSVALSIVAGALAVREKAVQEEVRDVELRALTDAALARTLAELKRKRSYPGLPDQEFGPGRISSKVKALSGLRVRVVAIATYGERQKAIEAQVRLDLNRPPRVMTWQRAAVPDSD